VRDPATPLRRRFFAPYRSRRREIIQGSPAYFEGTSFSDYRDSPTVKRPTQSSGPLSRERGNEKRKNRKAGSLWLILKWFLRTSGTGGGEGTV